MTTRRAIMLTSTTREQVQAYLPDNYHAVVIDGRVEIHGHDVAGWTLDGYVLPRLASGLHFAEEITQ